MGNHLFYNWNMLDNNSDKDIFSLKLKEIRSADAYHRHMEKA